MFVIYKITMNFTKKIQNDAGFCNSFVNYKKNIQFLLQMVDLKTYENWQKIYIFLIVNRIAIHVNKYFITVYACIECTNTTFKRTLTCFAILRLAAFLLNFSSFLPKLSSSSIFSNPQTALHSHSFTNHLENVFQVFDYATFCFNYNSHDVRIFCWKLIP